MALLYRFTKLHDRADSHVFTFVVTRSVTRDPERDVTSKELSCGYQRWAITFSRTDKVLGVYLVWRSACEGMQVYVDFSFTLLNREHFSVNEAFSGKQVKFTAESPAQGNRNYIAVSDLYARNFTDPNGEFQLELSMGHVRTVFEAELRVPTSFFGSLTGHHHYQHHHHHHGSRHGSTSSTGGGGGGPASAAAAGAAAAAAANSSPSNGAAADKSSSHVLPVTAGSSTKFETSYFSFGGFDWNLAIYPHTGKDENRLSVYLNRLTGFDHQCRVRYTVCLGSGDRRVDSGPLDGVSDTEGRQYGWHPKVRLSDLVHKGVVLVQLNLLVANTMSETALGVPGHSTVSGVGVGPGAGLGTGLGAGLGAGLAATAAGAAAGQCYDRDKQAWTLRSDLHSETVRLHMVYKDIHNVPRNHLRYVCWTAYLLRQHGPSGSSGHVETVPLPGAPFSHYYAQENSDEGIIMETDVTVKELRDPNCAFLADKGQLRVQVEWEESYLLFQATYHKYDDVSRVHNIQMRREISALQAENYSLERQLFSYQKSIAYAHSRGTYSDDPTTPDEYLEGRTYSMGDRSLSTDTEYA